MTRRGLGYSAKVSKWTVSNLELNAGSWRNGRLIFHWRAERCQRGRIVQLDNFGGVVIRGTILNANGGPVLSTSAAIPDNAGAMRSKAAVSRHFPRRGPTKITPGCLEDPLLRVRGRLTHVEKPEVISLSMKRVDINAACAFVTHLKTMNIVAHRGKGVNSSVRHHFVAGFPHAERFLRRVVWSVANDFEVT